jgi:hypothetical protein
LAADSSLRCKYRGNRIIELLGRILILYELSALDGKTSAAQAIPASGEIVHFVEEDEP